MGNKRHEKDRIKAEHLRQKLAQTYKKVVNIMDYISGKTRAEAAVEIVEKLSNKHLKRIVSNPKRFEDLSPEGDLARLAKDKLVLRTLEIEKE